MAKCLKLSELSTLSSSYSFFSSNSSKILANGDSIARQGVIMPIYETYDPYDTNPYNENYYETGYTMPVSGFSTLWYPCLAYTNEAHSYFLPFWNIEKNRVLVQDEIKIVGPISVLKFSYTGSNSSAYVQFAAYGKTGMTTSGYSSQYDTGGKGLYLLPVSAVCSYNGVTWHQMTASTSYSSNRLIAYYQHLNFSDSPTKTVFMSNFVDWEDNHHMGTGWGERNNRIFLANCEKASVDVEGNVNSLYAGLGDNSSPGAWTDITGGWYSLFIQQAAIRKYNGVINTAYWNTASMAAMFSNCSGMTNVPKLAWRFSSNLPSSGMSLGNGACQQMFENCYNLTTIDSPIPPFTMGKYKESYPISAQSNSLRYMFLNCTGLTSVNGRLDVVISGKTGSQVCQGMFANCRSLKKAPLLLDMCCGSTISTGTNIFGAMYSGCTALKEFICLGNGPVGVNLSATTSPTYLWLSGATSHSYTYGSGNFNQNTCQTQAFRFITRGYFTTNNNSVVSMSNSWSNSAYTYYDNTTGRACTVPSNAICYCTVNEYEMTGVKIRYGYGNLSRTAVLESSGETISDHIFRITSTDFFSTYISIDITFRRSGVYTGGQGNWPAKMWGLRSSGHFANLFNNDVYDVNKCSLMADGNWAIAGDTITWTDWCFNTNTISTGSTATAMTYCFGATSTTASSSSFYLTHFTDSLDNGRTEDLVIGFGHYSSGTKYYLPWENRGSLWPIDKYHIRIHFVKG